MSEAAARRVRRALGALALALATALPAQAEPYRLVLDPEATRVTFTLGATLHTVEGSFAMRSGELRFDPDTGEAAGRIVVDAQSGDTGIARRDGVMHEEVLASAEHPVLVLVAERIDVSRRGPDAIAGTLEGQFEVRGARHPITVAFEGSREGTAARVEARFAVPWVAWGLPDPSNWLLSVEKSLDVVVESRGVLSRAAARP
jgi:polyisoprenoid-binding protein YceI